MIQIKLQQFAKGGSGDDGISAGLGTQQKVSKNEYYESHGGSAGGSWNGYGAREKPAAETREKEATRQSRSADTLTNTQIKRNETYVLYRNQYGEDKEVGEVSGALLYTGRTYYYDSERKLWRDSQGNRYKVRTR